MKKMFLVCLLLLPCSIGFAQTVPTWWMVQQSASETSDASINLKTATFTYPIVVTSSMTYVLARPNSTQACGNATYTVLNWAVEQYDTCGEFVSPTFTAKQRGLYTIYVCSLLDATTTQLIGGYIAVNPPSPGNGVVATTYEPASAGMSHTIMVSKTVFLEAGDKVQTLILGDTLPFLVNGDVTNHFLMIKRELGFQ